jgi:hypothetical protein
MTDYLSLVFIIFFLKIVYSIFLILQHDHLLLEDRHGGLVMLATRHLRFQGHHLLAKLFSGDINCLQN